MNLSAASVLAGSQSRYVSEVYKIFQYKDDQTLRDYLDFVIHEPVEWLKGFPAKLVTKGAFSRPKTALLKLLKHADVQAELGDEYTSHVHDIVWTAFKQNADAIVAKRSTLAGNAGAGTHTGNAVKEDAKTEHEDESSVQEENEIRFEVAEDAESVHSVRLPRVAAAPTVLPVDPRYKVLEAAYLDLLSEFEASNPGLTASLRRLLSALSATSPASPSASS